MNKLTRNPLGDGSTHIELFVERIHHIEKRLASLGRAARCKQGFTETLSNRDAEIIKRPTGYLSKVACFDTLQL